jgi:hypothetical protein
MYYCTFVRFVNILIDEDSYDYQTLYYVTYLDVCLALVS